jgi:hypothetical protein
MIHPFIRTRRTDKRPQAADRSTLHLSAVVLLAIWAISAIPLVTAQATSNQHRPRHHRLKKADASITQLEDSKSSDSKPDSEPAELAVDPLNNDDQEKPKPVQTSAQPSNAQKTQSDPVNDDRKGEWVFAPIPVSSPAIGSGLEWAVGYVAPFSKDDKVSPPSMVGIGGLFTNNGSRGIAFGGRAYLKEDRHRVSLAGGHASINVDLYGVGRADGDRGVFLPVNAKGTAFFTEYLSRVSKGIYVGLRFQYRNLKLSLDRENADLPDDIEINPPPQVADIIEAIRGDLLRQRTIALGPRFQWDTRDNTFYPRRGIFLDSGIDFFAKPLGSKFTYQYYKIAFNKYTGMGEHQVLAFRGMGCAAAGDRVPVYDLCLFGFQNDLRGYSAGRYQDRRMFATQAEYRLTIPKTGFIGRFGLVGFGGFGGVGPEFTDISISEMLPSGGGGIRFRLTKKNPINFRIDYGFGKHGGSLSIGVGEAF